MAITLNKLHTVQFKLQYNSLGILPPQRKYYAKRKIFLLLVNVTKPFSKWCILNKKFYFFKIKSRRKCNVVQMYFTKLTIMAYNISLPLRQKKYDYFKLVEIVSILALAVDLYIESALLLPRNPKTSESVFNEFALLDHATEI